MPPQETQSANGIKKFRTKILFSILGFIILIGLIAFLAGSAGNVNVKNTFLTNQTSSSASIVWVTNKAAIGKIQISENADFTTVVEYFDDRDLEETGVAQYELTEQKKRDIHHVTLRGLNPEKTYYYRIVNNDKVYVAEDNTFKTPQVNENIVAPDPVYGKVANQNEGVVMLKKIAGDGSSQLVSVVISEGSYSIDAGNLLNESLTNSFVSQNYIEEISILSAGGITKAQIENDKDQPVQDIVVGQDVEIENVSIETQAEKYENPAIDNNCCNAPGWKCSKSEEWVTGYNACVVDGGDKDKCVCNLKGSSAGNNSDQTNTSTNGKCTETDGKPYDLGQYNESNAFNGQCKGVGRVERYADGQGKCKYKLISCEGQNVDTGGTTDDTSNDGAKPNTSTGKACWNGTIPHGSYSCLSTTQYVKCVDGAYSTTIKGTCSACRGTSTNLSEICQNQSGTTDDGTTNDNSTDDDNTDDNTNDSTTDSGTQGQCAAGEVTYDSIKYHDFAGNGKYCGKSDKTLYQCTGQCCKKIESCGNGCYFADPGKADRCCNAGENDTDTRCSNPYVAPAESVSGNGDGVPSGYKNIAPSSTLAGFSGSVDESVTTTRGKVPTNAIDGNSQTFWYEWTNGGSNSPSAAININLGGSYNVKKVRVKHSWDTRYNPNLKMKVNNVVKGVSNTDSTLWDEFDLNENISSIGVEYLKEGESGGWGSIYEIQILVLDTNQNSAATNNNSNVVQENTVSGGNQTVLTNITFNTTTLNLFECPKISASSTVTVSTSQNYPSASVRNVSADGKMYLVKIDGKTGWVSADAIKEKAQLPTLNTNQTTPVDQCYESDGTVQVAVGVTQPSGSAQTSNLASQAFAGAGFEIYSQDSSETNFQIKVPASGFSQVGTPVTYTLDSTIQQYELTDIKVTIGYTIGNGTYTFTRVCLDNDNYIYLYTQSKTITGKVVSHHIVQMLVGNFKPGMFSQVEKKTPAECDNISKLHIINKRDQDAQARGELSMEGTNSIQTTNLASDLAKADGMVIEKLVDTQYKITFPQGGSALEATRPYMLRVNKDEGTYSIDQESRQLYGQTVDSMARICLGDINMYLYVNESEYVRSVYNVPSDLFNNSELSSVQKYDESYCIDETKKFLTAIAVDLTGGDMGDANTVVIASEQGVLDPGSYKVEGTNVTTKEFTITEPGKVVYFQDLNGDGIKQDDEALYNGDVNALNIQFNKVSEVQSYSMSIGWNLVSFPIYMRGESTSNISKASELITQLNTGGVNTTHVVAYRSGKFITYSFRKDDSGNNVAFGEDFSILPGEGYFIRSYVPGIFIVTGKKIDSSQQIALDNGWNLVGIYNSNKLSYKGFEVLTQMNSAGIEADILSKWENGLYQNVVLQGGKEYGNNYSVYPYQGYFVRVKNRGTGTYSPQ